MQSCLGSYLLLGELSFPCPGFSLGGSCRLVVQTPGIFLESLLGFFPLASSVCCWLEVVQVNPWLSTLRSLAVEVVTLVLCQVLVGLPLWGYSASGFLGPVVFLVFPFVRGPPPQADAVGCGLRWSGGCPAFSRVGPPPLSWVPFLWTWLVWETPTVFLLHCHLSGCGHPLGLIVSFVMIAREQRFPLEVVSCTM